MARNIRKIVTDMEKDGIKLSPVVYTAEDFEIALLLRETAGKRAKQKRLIRLFLCALFCLLCTALFFWSKDGVILFFAAAFLIFTFIYFSGYRKLIRNRAKKSFRYTEESGTLREMTFIVNAQGLFVQDEREHGLKPWTEFLDYVIEPEGILLMGTASFIFIPHRAMENNREDIHRMVRENVVLKEEKRRFLGFRR